METKITKSARDELAYAVRERYQAAVGEDKRRIMGEFIAVSGYHPKYAIAVLNREQPGTKLPQSRHRRRLYDEAARQSSARKRMEP